MENKPSFLTMVDQLNPTYRQTQTKPRMGSMAPPLEAPTTRFSATLHNGGGGSSAPIHNGNISDATPPSNSHIANGNGTNQDHHPLSRSDSQMSTPPKKLPQTYSRSRIHPLQAPSEFTAGPLSPPSMGTSPAARPFVDHPSSLNRSGSTEFNNSPRSASMGISPRPKGANTSAPIPIASGYHSPSVNTYSPTSSPSPSPLSFSAPRNELAKDGSSKLGWLAEAVKKHPEVLQIMERVRPLGRAAAFGRTYNIAKTPSKDEFLVGRDHMVHLILQHLHYEGLTDARKMLEEEAGLKYIDPQLTESRLLNLMRMAVRDTERVWELTLSTASEAPHLLEEHLSDLSLLQEDPALDADDVNIWDEAEEGSIQYTDETAAAAAEAKTPVSPGGTPSLPTVSNDISPVPGEKSRSIKAASLNRLIAMLALEEKHDIEYMKTFLLTYQSFTTPAKLLQKLVQRYHVPIQSGMSEEKYKQICVVIQLRVVNVMKFWINHHYSDFNDKLIVSLKLFIEGTLRLDNPSYATMLTSALNTKIPEDQEEKKAKKFNDIPPEPRIPKNIFSLYLDLFDVDEEEIARQMTLIDFEIYSSIKMAELLNQSWNKPKLRHKAPNVIRMINRFNDVSHWVVTSILRQEKIRDRARTMAKLVRIADYMLKPLNNFNSAMAILAGFNAAAVHRLKHTKEEMPRAIQITYDSLQHTLDSNRAYLGYRTLLSNANPPCIPYLGIYLTDLTFIDDGNPDFIGKLINFGKRKLVYTVIDKVKQYQQSAYNLQPVYQISTLLVHPVREVMDDDKQFKLSLAREPRNVERSEIQ